jgi:hypothetical protein
MAGLVPVIHVFFEAIKEGVDAGGSAVGRSSEA